MPDIVRTSQRMVCNGIDLVHPIDRMPEGAFPYLFNVRVIEEGRIEGRPGYTSFAQLSDVPNSIRRLNDPSLAYAPTGYIYVGGGGPNLYAGVESAYAVVAGGFSGDPLSLIPFRPENSPESWMYVYDRLKMAKVRPDGVVRDIGVAPPPAAPTIEYAGPAWVQVADGQSSAGWTPTSGTVGTSDRTNSSLPSVSHILYAAGSSGWACINPQAVATLGWAGERMQIILNSGGGNQEVVVVREIHPAITTTTVEGIQYDAGSSGVCSLVLTTMPDSLDRNSLIQINSEVVRVLEVITAPNGVDKSIRCNTTATHSIGETVTGLLSWFTFTVLNHNAGEGISAHFISASEPSTAGSASMSTTVALNLASADGRLVDPVNDWFHISLFLQNPQFVDNVKLMICLDPTPTFDFANPGNSYVYTIPAAALASADPSGDAWVDVVQSLGSGVRHGQDLSKSLANVTGIAIQLTAVGGGCTWGWDWWYIFGTYGPEIQPSSPTGYIYESRFRDSSTNARSVPSPATRYQLYPLREGILVTPLTSNQAGVDQIDIYRQGGTVESMLYVGSVLNNPPGPNSYLDGLPDTQVNSTAQAPDLDVLQPWPTLQLPWSGTVDVVGTSVMWHSGDQFNTALVSASIITINGVAYQTYGQPSSATRLQLIEDAGVQSHVPYEISSPTLAGQPLPFAYGALEGPFAPVVFALGDPINGGLLYFSNFSDADSASDANTLELAPPSSNLVSGAVWNGLSFAGNRDDLFCTRFSYLTQIGASNSNSFQWAKVPNVPSGIWSRWACCPCSVGVAYLGRDGIYIATENGSINISDDRLYSLFPHDGEPATAVNFGNNIIPPVDMSLVNFLRLTYCDNSVRFSYVDTGGNWNTLIYEIPKKRWFLNHYADTLTFHYLVEASEEDPLDQEILALATNVNRVVKMGGDTDAGADIFSIVLTASDDAKDEREQKLYVDSMHMADGTGDLEIAAAYDYAQSYSTPVTKTLSGSIEQVLANLSSLDDLTLHLNIGTKYSWTGGPSGPRIYAWESSGYMQPYLSEFFVTQINALSFPGWKHTRRMWPALISNGDVRLTILCQDGRTFGPYTIPTTSGRYRQLPQMLDQNIKDLAFALQLDGLGRKFAFFPNDFVMEVKEWTEDSYIKLAVFRA